MGSPAMRRLLHYLPEAPELAGQNIIRAAPVVDPRVPQTPKFTVLGLGSLLQVQLPPSIKLTSRRNALTGVLGSIDSLTSRLRLARSPVLRLAARQPMFEQTIVGTQPLVCLLGSPAAAPSHLSAIELDGALDWVVTRPARVHAYCGAQLRLTPRSGWRLGGLPYAHTVVSGRGSLCLASPLSVVQFHVPAGESVLVQKNHLNAYTVDTNAAHTPPKVQHLAYQFAPVESTEPPLARAEPKPATRLAAAWGRVRAESARAWRAGAAWIRRRLNSGNTSPFVQIQGPSTVLVSAASRPPSPASAGAPPTAGAQPATATSNSGTADAAGAPQSTAAATAAAAGTA